MSASALRDHAALVAQLPALRVLVVPVHPVQVLVALALPQCVPRRTSKSTESVYKKSAFKNASAFALGSSIKVVAND